MNYPFTSEQFLEVITQYNTAVWPAQILFYIIALAVIFHLFRSTKNSSRMVSGIMALLWLWMGVVYHWVFFSEINPAARMFAIAFILEALLFFYFGTLKTKLQFQFDKSFSSYVGISLIAIGLLIYPLIGYIIGHRFPGNPTFGLPCPTTIFTLGMVLLTTDLSKRLIVIPFIWSVIGFMAAVSFGIKEDVLLLISGIIALTVIVFRKQRAVEIAGNSNKSVHM